MELGKKIRQLRFKAQLTQEQLAERLGIGPQSVSKWETGVAMPDITTLPLLAEIFGVSIDDLFDLTAEQRLNRIENRMDVEEELPQDIFWEYEEFLKSQLSDEQNKDRAVDLLAYLYWHRMNSYGKKAIQYAGQSVRNHPDVKNNQWILSKAAGHAIWDWNLANHHQAVEFYRQLISENPQSVLSYEYLIDNLLADRRADEAEECLKKLESLPGSNPLLNEAYRAHIALARFDEKTADEIMETMVREHPQDDVALFETAQYYAGKSNYQKAIDYYERSFACSKRQPRFQDELMAIAEIYEIIGDYRKAAESYDRIIELLEKEWGMSEDVELKNAQQEKARLLAKAQHQ